MKHTLEGKLYVTGIELDRIMEEGKEVSMLRYGGHFQILRVDEDSYLVQHCTGNKTERYKIIKYIQRREKLE